MVTLRVTGNIETNVAKLNEYQLSQLRQAADYYSKALELMDSILFSNEFKDNNKGSKRWVDAHSAVSHFIFRSEKDKNIKKEIIYEESTNA